MERRASRPPTGGKRLWLVALLLAGCSRDETVETSTFYERRIAPPLRESCVSSPTRSSCHVSDGMGNAFGNLTFESYDTLNKRRDLFVSYGPYGIPGLLLKVVPLMAALPGVLRGRRYTLQWSTLVIWFYAAEGATRAYTDSGLAAALAVLELALALAYFWAVVAWLRAMPRA